MNNIEEFLNLQTNFKTTTRAFYKRVLTIFFNFNGPRKQISKKSILLFINSDHFNDLEISSQNRYKTVLRKLCVFLEINPDFIKKKREIIKELNKEDLLTPGEIENILDRMSRNIDKCLFMVLLEGKIRIGEASKLRVGDLVDKGTHYNMYIRESKTAQRTIPLVSAVPYIIQYVNNHPLKNDPKSSFFITRYNGKVKEYSISGLRQIITRSTTHLQKRIYPHLLRHTGLTNSAKFLSDSLLMQIAGWRTRSMVSRYVHLASDDLETKILELHGIKTEKEKESIKLIENKECPRCQFLNAGTNKFCSRCGSALDLKTVGKYNQIYEKVKNNKKELFELFEEFIQDKFKESG